MPGTKGNTNALKHGLYARHFTPGELKILDENADDLSNEINNLCIFVDRLSQMLKDKSTYDDTDRANLAHITAMSATIGTLTTRRAFMTGKVSIVNEAIEEAVQRRSTIWLKA